MNLLKDKNLMSLDRGQVHDKILARNPEIKYALVAMSYSELQIDEPSEEIITLAVKEMMYKNKGQDG